jgi:hypothetical protein
MKLGLSRREIRILMVGWFFVCLALLGGVYWFVRQSSFGSYPVGNLRPAPQATFTMEFTSLTARQLFPVARDRAMLWQADAQLASATANWEKTAINLVGQPTTWTFRFYSPGLARFYFVTVRANSQVDGVSHGTPTQRSPRLLAIDQWTVDSPEAINLWLNYGGSQMLASVPGIQVAAQLSAARTSDLTPTWTVAGYNRENDSYHTVIINAQSGEVVEVKSGTGS